MTDDINLDSIAAAPTGFRGIIVLGNDAAVTARILQLAAEAEMAVRVTERGLLIALPQDGALAGTEARLAADAAMLNALESCAHEQVIQLAHRVQAPLADWPEVARTLPPSRHGWYQRFAGKAGKNPRY